MAAQAQTAPTILRRRQVEARTGLSRSTIYQYIRAGVFPLPINLGGKSVCWIETEISDWLNQQIDNSRKA